MTIDPSDTGRGWRVLCKCTTRPSEHRALMMNRRLLLLLFLPDMQLAIATTSYCESDVIGLEVQVLKANK